MTKVERKRQAKRRQREQEVKGKGDSSNQRGRPQPVQSDLVDYLILARKATQALERMSLALLGAMEYEKEMIDRLLKEGTTMSSIPRRVEDRLVESLKHFQPILSAARARDVNEADTVVIVTDLLADLFGHDKYTEITREYAIRGTFCDLAIKIEDQPRLLIEVKAIGLELKDAHVRQAVDYAANQGVEWVALTNGIEWKVFRVNFGKPVDQELVLTLDFLSLNHRTPAHIESLYPLTREGLLKSALSDYHIQRQAMSRFSLAVLLLSEPILRILRRELRRLSPGANIDIEEIKEVLTNEVLKREVVEGEKAEEARKRIQRAIRRQLRHGRTSGEPAGQEEVGEETGSDDEQAEEGDPEQKAEET